jgi:hypothetical protein
MKVVFSSAFKRDLLEAESRYAAISLKLGDDFHERTKEASEPSSHEMAATMSGRMVSAAGSAGRFPISSTTKSPAM